MNEVEEVAKATQEVSKLATQTGKQAEGVIKTLFGPAANHLGKILGAEMALIRVKHGVRVLNRLADIKKKHGLQLMVNDSNAALLSLSIERASSEADESLQELWANLLANTARSDQGPAIRKAYSSILSEMDPLDALALEKVEELCKGSNESGPNYEALSKALDTDQAETRLAVANLARLNLIDNHLGPTVVLVASGPSQSGILMTDLGRAFLRACRLN